MMDDMIWKETIRDIFPVKPEDIFHMRVMLFLWFQLDPLTDDTTIYYFLYLREIGDGERRIEYHDE